MVAFLVSAVVVLGLCFLYVRRIARSRRSIECLYAQPDDLKRADANQPPPFDGSAGWV
ncbi:hypothetical protein [Nocardioides marmorisolisilvae]|uniref:hypothetical protein n=1 Tax=Nocardioides marmorisolisilvae TaxID=1542737 RepID=UPI00161F2D8E|nr:hypothetical protein [Nocardioides marmorisolisilvae]